MAEDAAEQAAVEKVRDRRERISLAAIGIKPGAMLTFSRDENRTVQVMSDKLVLMEGQQLTLSRAAITTLQQMGYKTTHASGSVYWLYEGETLDERRRRLDEETFDDAIIG